MKFTKKELAGIIKICDAVSKIRDGVASDILAEIKKYNPNATYRIQSKPTKTYEGDPAKLARILIKFPEGINKQFVPYIKKYNVRFTKNAKDLIWATNGKEKIIPFVSLLVDEKEKLVDLLVVEKV